MGGIIYLFAMLLIHAGIANKFVLWCHNKGGMDVEMSVLEVVIEAWRLQSLLNCVKTRV